MSQVLSYPIQRLSELLSQPHSGLRRLLPRFLHHQSALKVEEALVEVLEVVFEALVVRLLQSMDILVLVGEQVLLEGGGNGGGVKFGAAEHKAGEGHDIVHIH